MQLYAIWKTSHSHELIFFPQKKISLPISLSFNPVARRIPFRRNLGLRPSFSALAGGRPAGESYPLTRRPAKQAPPRLFFRPPPSFTLEK